MALRKDDGVSSSGHCCTAAYKDGVTLDIAAWPLHKNDSQDLRWVVFFSRTIRKYGLHKDDTHKSSHLNVKKAWPLRNDDNS